MAIIIGAKGSDRLPRFVEVVNNTILTGFKRIDGYAGSLRISRAYRYGGYSRRQRPLIANNVIGLLRTWDASASARADRSPTSSSRVTGVRAQMRLAPSTSTGGAARRCGRSS